MQIEPGPEHRAYLAIEGNTVITTAVCGISGAARCSL
jgi:hypothetical protein